MIDFDFDFANTQTFFQGPSSCQMEYAGPYFATDVASTVKENVSPWIIISYHVLPCSTELPSKQTKRGINSPNWLKLE